MTGTAGAAAGVEVALGGHGSPESPETTAAPVPGARLAAPIGLVDSIGDPAGLAAIADAWEAVHRSDPLATVFTSPDWLRGRLAGVSDPWCVLVVRRGPGQPVIGVLPLRVLPASPAEQIPWAAADERLAAGGETVPGLGMAGSPLADYTGFVCAPGEEGPALAALADHLRRRTDWRFFQIRDALDPRLESFLAHFAGAGFRIERHPSTPCPCLELDPDWETFLARRPRPRMRREIRHDLRALEKLPGFRRSGLTGDGSAQIAVLLDLWQRRWGVLPEPQLAQYRAIFRACHAAGRLWLDILWDRDVPVTGLLGFLDRDRDSFRFYITGFDRRYAALSPGTVIVAHAIREAIRAGYRFFDFLRGDEPYKFALGAALRHTENVTIHRLTTGEPRRRP